tara:strand:- start:1066 stop:1548 length:483 start_codon:yes stop_codon:yes gene_type:complete
MTVGGLLQRTHLAEVINMKKEDYEKQIQELNEQALRLEKTMQTYRDLEEAKRDGHELIALIDSSQFGEVSMIEIVCRVSGANYLIEPKTPMQLEIPNDPKLFGDLAGKKLKDIEIDVDQPSQKTTETDEKPPLPLESSLDPDGTYKVDVSSIMNKRKQEE